MWFQVFLSNTNNLVAIKWFQMIIVDTYSRSYMIYSNLILMIFEQNYLTHWWDTNTSTPGQSGPRGNCNVVVIHSVQLFLGYDKELITGLLFSWAHSIVNSIKFFILCKKEVIIELVSTFDHMSGVARVSKKVADERSKRFCIRGKRNVRFMVTEKYHISIILQHTSRQFSKRWIRKLVFFQWWERRFYGI